MQSDKSAQLLCSAVGCVCTHGPAAVTGEMGGNRADTKAAQRELPVELSHPVQTKWDCGSSVFFYVRRE